MKYTVVKQFSNGVLDNIFSFMFKWADCGKMFLEFIWSFIEIWIAFFLIFYNAFMYVYYLFLFFIDRGAETSAGMFRIRGTYGKASYMPPFEVTKAPTTVPPMYSVSKTVGAAAEAAATRTAETAAQTLTSIRSAAKEGMKRTAGKEFFNSTADFFKSLGAIIILPFKK